MDVHLPWRIHILHGLLGGTTRKDTCLVLACIHGAGCRNRPLQFLDREISQGLLAMVQSPEIMPEEVFKYASIKYNLVRPLPIFYSLTFSCS